MTGGAWKQHIHGSRYATYVTVPWHKPLQMLDATENPSDTAASSKQTKGMRSFFVRAHTTRLLAWGQRVDSESGEAWPRGVSRPRLRPSGAACAEKALAGPARDAAGARRTPCDPCDQPAPPRGRARLDSGRDPHLLPLSTRRRHRPPGLRSRRGPPGCKCDRRAAEVNS